MYKFLKVQNNWGDFQILHFYNDIFRKDNFLIPEKYLPILIFTIVWC